MDEARDWGSIRRRLYRPLAIHGRGGEIKQTKTRWNRRETKITALPAGGRVKKASDPVMGRLWAGCRDGRRRQLRGRARQA